VAQPQPPTRTGARLLDDILCGVNGSRHAYEAVRQAASLAGPTGHLTLLAVSDVHGEGRYRTATLAPLRARRALDRAERIAAQTGVPADSEIDERSPVADVLLERARGHRLLAIGPPSMSRVAHLLVGGTATTAAHLLPASILVARRAPSGAHFGERILVASDALEHSDELVDFAIELARERGASLTLLHATHGEASQHPTRTAGQVERVTRSLGDQATVLIEPGRARALILETATAERCSLIVLSSRRIGGLRALGSVSERVVHDAPCSVLVVRPEDLQGNTPPGGSATTVQRNRAPASGDRADV
jgi:nucleotide-binding universal stress UspA family protein